MRGKDILIEPRSIYYRLGDTILYGQIIYAKPISLYNETFFREIYELHAPNEELIVTETIKELMLYSIKIRTLPL